MRGRWSYVNELASGSEAVTVAESYASRWMINSISPALHPLMLLQDRYSGTYSGGEWIAVGEANRLVGTASRAAWIIERGPSGGDAEASAFWVDPPDWIAVGNSPELAIEALVNKRQRSVARLLDGVD